MRRPLQAQERRTFHVCILLLDRFAGVGLGEGKAVRLNVGQRPCPDVTMCPGRASGRVRGHHAAQPGGGRFAGTGSTLKRLVHKGFGTGRDPAADAPSH